MVSSSPRIDLHRALQHDLHRTSGYGAKSMNATMTKPQVSMKVIQLTITTISHHEPHCKIKLDVLPFILLQILRGC